MHCEPEGGSMSEPADPVHFHTPFLLKSKKEKKEILRNTVKEKKNVTYPTTSINGGPYIPIFQIDQLSDIVDICIGTIRKHGSASGEPEPVLLEPDPILLLLLHRQLLMRHVGKPNGPSALRPPERNSVPVRCRNSTPQNLAGLRAVPLSVYQSFPIEPQRPPRVFTRRVLADLRRTPREVVPTRRRGRWVLSAVVGREVEVDGCCRRRQRRRRRVCLGGKRARCAAGEGKRGGSGDGAGGVVPYSGEVAERTED